MHQNKYIGYLEQQVADLQHEKSELERKLVKRDGADDDLSVSEVSNLSGITQQLGRPQIDAVSAISYDHMQNAQETTSILDTEVRGMDKFAKISVPLSHLNGGRGKSDNQQSAAGSSINNQSSEGSRHQASRLQPGASYTVGGGQSYTSANYDGHKARRSTSNGVQNRPSRHRIKC